MPYSSVLALSRKVSSLMHERNAKKRLHNSKKKHTKELKKANTIY
jgi:hypothetical protein